MKKMKKQVKKMRRPAGATSNANGRVAKTIILTSTA
jgi:hypothetical protein